MLAKMARATISGILIMAGASATLADESVAKSSVERERKDANEILDAVTIELPRGGATIGAQVAVVFRTRADLKRLTMDERMPHAHLHIQLDENNVAMPRFSDLIALGDDLYLYVFDLPARPGPHTLGVYWSNARHEAEKPASSVAVIVGEGELRSN